MVLRGIILGCLFLVMAGCRQDMHDQPKFKPYRANSFFTDDRSARPLVADTVPRGGLQEDAHFYTGKAGEKFVETFPFPVTKEVILRGQERFTIYCTPCHGRMGDGEGMVVQRGFRRPSSFHIDRLREAPAGYFFNVITNGFGAMYDFADRIPPRDRWAIISYIRTLQLSQHATLEDVPEKERHQLVGTHQ